MTIDVDVEGLRSSDSNERRKALAALVRQGRAALPALLPLLGDADDTLRVQAARALSEIADPASADALFGALADSVPEVRAHAAMGLARIGDDRAIDALVRTINDAPDPLHHPYTLSAYALIDLGERALEAVARLLSADDPTTRERARAVVHAIVTSLGQDPEEWIRDDA